MNFSKNDSDRYAVRLVRDKKKVERITRPSRFRQRASFIGKTVSRFVSASLIAVMMFLGLISFAGPAQAGWIDDGFKGAMCSTGNYGYELEAISMSPKTMDPNSPDATAYEKYGMSGATWSLWVGPEGQEGLDDGGKFNGVSIVADAGGKNNNGGIDKWGDSDKEVDGVSTVYPAFYNTKQECAPVDDAVTNAIANGLLGASKWLVNISGLVYQIATEQSSGVVAQLEPTIENMVDAMRDAFFYQFLNVALIAAALFLAWKGLVKREFTVFARDGMWMVGAVIASFILLNNPMALPRALDTAVSSITQPAVSTLTGVASKSAGNGNICHVNPSQPVYYPADTKDAGSSDKQVQARRSVRETQCNLWYAFVYKPWEAGQFGENQKYITADWGTAGNIGKPLDGSTLDKGVSVSGKNIKDNNALSYLDNKVISSDAPETVRVTQQRNLLNIAAAQTHRDDPNMTYKGETPLNRVFIAGSSLVAAVCMAFLVVAVGIVSIALQLLGYILLIPLPLLLLAGIHPGQGRRMLLGYLEVLAGLAIKRIVLSVGLGIMIAFYSILITSGLPWMLTNIMIVALTVGVIMYKDQILTQVSKINFGSGGYGEKFINSHKEKKREFQRGLGKVASVGAAVATLATTGNPQAAMTAGKIAEGATAGAGGRPNDGASETSTDSRSQANTDGAGSRPASSSQTSEEYTPNLPSEHASSTSGAGAEPATTPAEPSQTHQSVFIPDTDSRQDRKNRARVEKENLKRIEEARRREGYRRTVVSPGLVARTFTAAALTKITTGSTTGALLSATQVVSKERSAQQKQNAYANNLVMKQEREAYIAQTAPPTPAPQSAPTAPAPAQEAPAPTQEAPVSPQKPAPAPQPAPERQGPQRATSGALPPLRRTGNAAGGRPA